MPRIPKNKLIWATLIIGLANNAYGSEQIMCVHPGRSDVMITLGASKFNCIEGDFFWIGSNECAPTGGWELHGGGGNDPLIGHVASLYDTKFTGKVTQSFVSPHVVNFIGGHIRSGAGPAAPRFEEDYTFSINRLTGTAELKQPQKDVVLYDCKKATPKF